MWHQKIGKSVKTMLKRKIEGYIRSYLTSNSNKILIVSGARQVGKSYIIRHVGQELFANYIELNMAEDQVGRQIFANVRTVEDFYFAMSTVAGDKMKDKQTTLVFIDEIQTYSHLLTLLKFLKADDRFTYIASGSLLGVTLKQTPSIPIGSIIIKKMYPLDFEEFLWANHVGTEAIDKMKQLYEECQALPLPLHERMMNLFKMYMLVGGLPDAVNQFTDTNNIVEVRAIHNDIHHLYKLDAARYEEASSKKLMIQRIYDMVPSNLENRKKRVVAKKIEEKKNARINNYSEEFEYLIHSGIALEVLAVSQPTYPLVQSMGKNLLKLYMNDVGLFTSILFRHDIKSVMDDIRSINLGSVYETLVAQELSAHNQALYYYDNKQKGEVDFLINDIDNHSVIPIEVKSGKDYSTHRALDKFITNPDYNVHKAIVLSNESSVYREGAINYLPIYYIMFVGVE